MGWRGRVALSAVALLGVLAVWSPIRSHLVVSVRGGSMEPALLPADVVLVRKDSAPPRGSIALLRSHGGSLVLHRVVSTESSGAVHTRGDANPVEDLEATPPERILGTVTAVLPAGRLIGRWRGEPAYDTLTAQQNSARR